MQNRVEAKSKYEWGNKFLAKQTADAEEGIQNVLQAISYYTKSLFHLRCISKEEAIGEDDKRIQDVLTALLQGINKLLCLSSDWFQVVDELEKFLKFYVDSLKILNKTRLRLPGLDALELKIDGPFTVLSAKAPSVPQKERFKNYLAVISLFHLKLATEKNHKLASNDPIVIESFALYNRALKALEATVKFEWQVEEELPPSKEVPPPSKEVPLPPELPQPSAVRVQQSATASLPSPRFNSAQRFKGSEFRLFDYVAADGPKRAGIREMMGRKEFVKALEVFRRLIDRNAEDLRCACDCQLIIGEDHARNSRFTDAIVCYKDALDFCKQMQKDDVIAVDIMNITKVFRALVNTMNEVTKKIWSVNFSLASQSMAEFLHYYLDNFEVLNSSNKKLPGLDEINLDYLIKFLHGTCDGAFRNKTTVYIAIIAMFQKEPKLEKGELESMMAEIEIQKGAWKDVTMLNIVDLYEKALALVKKIQGHEVLNRELNIAPEPKEKRHKGGVESSSSSSLTPFGHQ